MSDPCGKAWDRLSQQLGRATDGHANADAYCRARRMVERCLAEHGHSFAEATDGMVEPFVCPDHKLAEGQG